MKKWFSFLMIITCFCLFSLTAFAKNYYKYYSFENLPNVNGLLQLKDRTLYVGPLDYTRFSDEQKNFLDEWKNSENAVATIKLYGRSSVQNYVFNEFHLMILSDVSDYSGSVYSDRVNSIYPSSDYIYSLNFNPFCSYKEMRLMKKLSGSNYTLYPSLISNQKTSSPLNLLWPISSSPFFEKYPLRENDGNVFYIDYDDVVFYGVGEDPFSEHTLTIKYQYEDGSSAAEAHTETIKEGETYSVLSPVLNGYTASQTTVTGTMPAEDVSITVTYTKVPHTLTIRYQYEDGRAAAETHTETLKEGETYNVSSPALEGYTASQITVSGIMPAQDVSVTVTYTKDEPPPSSSEPDPPQPPGPSEPDPPSPGTDDGKVMEYSMFYDFFEVLRKQGGVVVTAYFKTFLLVFGLMCAIGIIRKVILSAVSGGKDDPPEVR